MFRRILAGGVALVAAFVFGTTITHALLYSPDSEVVATNASDDATSVISMHASAPAAYPVRLQIPSLGVDAKVQYVGITSHGTMSVPNNFSDVGWYKYGSVPGTAGSAVMAGHVDNALALPGVFKHLEDVQEGADVYVTTKGGSVLHFVVDDVKVYDAADVPTERIFEHGGTPRLNLITCEGSWIQSQHQYDHRLVVYTHLAD